MSYDIAPAMPAISENGSTLSFILSRGDGSLAETLYLSTTPSLGFANSGDYLGLRNLPISFAVGELTTTVSLTILNDAISESSESFGLIVQRLASDPVSSFLSKTSFTIIDDDPTPLTSYALTPEAVSVREPDGSITFTITRSGTLRAETLYTSTTPNLGFANSGDYAGLRDQPITFAEGQATATISIAVTNDALAETAESFGLILQRYATDAVGTYLAKASFTIADDDMPAPATYALSPASSRSVNRRAFSPSRDARGHACGGDALCQHNPQSRLCQQWRLRGASGSSVIFAEGQAMATVSIAITDDSVAESAESFGLILQRYTSDPISTFLARTTFTIDDNDAQPASYALSPDASRVSESAGTVTFTITRSGSLAAETLYASTTPNMGYSNSGDYAGLRDLPVLFAQGQATATVTIAITDDALVEAAESFGLILQRLTSDPIGTYLARTSFTIEDNDKTFTAPVALSLYPAAGSTASPRGTATTTAATCPTRPANGLMTSSRRSIRKFTPLRQERSSPSGRT